MKSSELRKNNLVVSIDYLAFTVKGRFSPSGLLRSLGMDGSQFREMSHGAYGYKSMLCHKSENISVLYDGGKDMGIHVNITGSAISYALESFKESKRCNTPFGVGYDLPADYPERLMILYLGYIHSIADITRIDAAIDDFTEDYFTVSDVQALVDEKRLVSPFRKCRYYVEKDACSGSKTGETFYLGSRQSDVFLRVYNKALEQKNYDLPWVRWELEIKGAKADLFVKALENADSIGSIVIGVLSRYVRFINLDDSNRSRCSVFEKWASFVDNVKTLHLTVSKKEFSVPRKEYWVKRQCLPTIAGLIYAHDGDLSWLLEEIPYHFSRLSKEEQDGFINFLRSVIDVHD